MLLFAFQLPAQQKSDVDAAAAAVAAITQPSTSSVASNSTNWSESAKIIRAQLEEERTQAQLNIRAKAEEGDADAQLTIGIAYLFGTTSPPALYGAPQDYVRAVKWIRRSANQGNANGQNYLGWMFEHGRGVPQDYVEAYKWYDLAAAQGQTNAILDRDIIVESMTPEQIAEGTTSSPLRLFLERKRQVQIPIQIHRLPPITPAVTGTGFFITDDGYLISNYHVVKDATKVRLLTSAGLIDAKVVQVDAANDLALLKADGRFAPLPIAASRTVNLGGTVATVGFPDIGLQGFAPKLAKGEIASLSGAGDDPRYFQISVPVQPGNSGGALVDERGNVIGIVSAKLDASAALAASGALPENVNYAVKSSLLLSFLESVPAVSAKLKAPNTADEKFSDVVKSAQAAAVLVLVY